VKVEEIEVEHEDENRNSKIEKERSRKNYPEISTQLFIDQPRSRAHENKGGASAGSLGIDTQQLLH
jgi:hypothetical protein